MRDPKEHLPENQLKQLFLNTKVMQDYLNAESDDADFEPFVRAIIQEVYGPHDPKVIGGFLSAMGFYTPKRNLIYKILKEMNRLPKSLVEHEAVVQANIDEYERFKKRGFKGLIKAAESEEGE